VSNDQLGEGLVVRFHDDHGKVRPAIILAVLENDGYVYAIDGTTQRHWQDTGTKVLLEVAPQSRIRARMGLASSTSTFFYARKSALHLIPIDRLMLSSKHAYSCPQTELRTLQVWAFEVLRAIHDDVAQVGAGILAASIGSSLGSPQ